MKKWINETPEIEWIEPQAGVVCFPRIKPEINIDLKKFYNTLNFKYHTYIGPGHWFGFSKRYFRIGYSHVPMNMLQEGLDTIEKSIKNSLE